MVEHKTQLDGCLNPGLQDHNLTGFSDLAGSQSFTWVPTCLRERQCLPEGTENPDQTLALEPAAYVVKVLLALR